MGNIAIVLCFAYADFGPLLRTDTSAKRILTQFGHFFDALARNLDTRGLTLGHLARHQVRPQLTKSLMNAVYKKNKMTG